MLLTSEELRMQACKFEEAAKLMKQAANILDCPVPRKSKISDSKHTLNKKLLSFYPFDEEVIKDVLKIKKPKKEALCQKQK